MLSAKTSLSKFQQIFHSPNIAAISLGMEANYSTQFSKNIYPYQKWGSLSIFKFVTKSAKHQIASVSLTVQDRAISSKFLKHTVSKITTLPKNYFSYILALLSYKQNFLASLSCHYFSFSGRFVFAMKRSCSLIWSDLTLGPSFEVKQG